MDQNRRLKPTIIRYAVLSLLCIIAAVVLNRYFTRGQNDLGRKMEAMKEVLQGKESKLHDLLREVTLLNPEAINFPLIHEKLPPGLWQNDGMLVFVYLRDSLIYWSDYNAPARLEFPRQLFHQPFIQYGNGWFRVMTQEQEQLSVTGLILVKNDFPYQNEYLVNQFRKEFNLPDQVSLDTVPGNTDYYDSGGQFVFSMTPPEESLADDETGILMFVMMNAAFVFFILLLFYFYHAFSYFRERPVLLLLAFAFDALLIRFLTVYFEFPGFLYQTSLFSPHLYATSFYSPSLGDLVMNSLLWLILAWAAYRTLKPVSLPSNKYLRDLAGILSMVFIAALFFRLVSTISSMVNDSNLELNLNNIFNIDMNSGLGFFSLTCLILAFFLVSARLTSMLCRSSIKTGKYVIFVLVAVIAMAPFFILSEPGYAGWIYPVFLLCYLLTFPYLTKKQQGYHSVSGALLYIVMFSMITTFALDFHYSEKEKAKRKSLASALSSRRDPLMEFEFMKVKENIMADSVLLGLLEARTSNRELDNEILWRLENKYFNTFWSKYEKVITLCHETDILNIQPGSFLVNCFDFFMDYADKRNAQWVSPGLYFLNYTAENNNYLAVFEFITDNLADADTSRIFVEFSYKYLTETGLGYPDLLIDRKAEVVSGLGDYSYARYVHEALIYKFGDFSYNLGFEAYDLPAGQHYFMEQKGYSHYVVSVDEGNKLIISKKTLTFLDLIAPFSYLVIFFGLFLLGFLFVVLLPDKFRQLEFNFSNQLQVSIIAIIIVSFIVLGMITRANIIHLYNNKNRDNLSEKALSVNEELVHKIGDVPAITPDMHNYIYELLNKFSLVFFSDINLYDNQGNLIASSRPLIFDEELISTKMHSEAFQKLAFEHNMLYIQEEKIGNQQYLSAYFPFRNINDEIIAYLNLPYFAKQTELRKEIADFLAAYINVYVLLIVLAIMVTIVVSRVVTRPLKLVAEKLGKIGLGKANEKITWNRKDEIGKLVEEYNRMIDELDRSAELLASSERESAWREMARQVAHEIKNPLTPMKLSVQYLQKAWEEKSPDWENRLERFTRTIIEQIDSLSEIASEFSDFAQMPAANLQRIELTGVVKTASDLYHHLENITLSIDHPAGQAYVLADRRQLLRVFNNVVQNAVQAIGQKENGLIRIRIRRDGDFYRVDITDNGSGITDEQAKKIFSPSFTTKSSGMGLGLAMVKSIMTTLGGDVTFTSVVGDGTTFTLKIPVYPE